MEHQPNGTAGLSPAIWINRADQLPIPADRDPLGFDTEFERRDTFFPKLALAQASHHADCWLIDPLAYDAGADLHALLANRVCIMHSASEDLEALAPWLGDAPLQLFDTQIAAALCGLGVGLSYQKLVATVLGIDIPKDETRSDWMQRPLSAGQLTYAAQDVAHFDALHHYLTGKLRELGRESWQTQDCARLQRRAQQQRTATDPQPQRGFSSASDWPREAQTRLRQILLWREHTARSIDRPRPWLLDDAHALALARQAPASAAELFERVKGQRALRGPQREELLQRLQTPPSAEALAATAPIPPPIQGEAKRALEAIRGEITAIAQQLDLPASLLCPRRLAEEFVATRSWPDELSGWRAELLQARLSRRLPD